MSDLEFHADFWNDLDACEGVYQSDWIANFLIDLRNLIMMGIEDHASKDSAYTGSGEIYRWHWAWGGGQPKIEVRILVHSQSDPNYYILGAYTEKLDSISLGEEMFFDRRYL